MRKATIAWLVIATALVLIGCILFGGVMFALGWDFRKLSTVEYETNTYDVNEPFKSISLKTDTADIKFALSNDGKCKVECLEDENAKHSVTVEDGTLTVELIDERSVSDYIKYIGINYGSSRITVYLPKGEYASLVIEEDTGDIEIPDDFNFRDVDISVSTGNVVFGASASKSVSIKTSTGDIAVENISVGSLALSVTTGRITATSVNCEDDLTVGVSTGKVYLTDIVCENVISRGSTGDITLNNVIAEEKLLIKRSTGDVKLDGCDAGEISVETSTGDVVGSLLSDKVFNAETSTGRCDVPKTTTGGKCEISTDTGDIKIVISP